MLLLIILLILNKNPLSFNPKLDRNKTDLRRFKPNSCAVLFNEQLNPSKLLRLEDTTPLSFNPKLDRNKTDLRRFKPNSCAVLFNEQLNPSKLLRLEDTTNRHRGHKQKFRSDRLIFIILLSLK